MIFCNSIDTHIIHNYQESQLGLCNSQTSHKWGQNHHYVARSVIIECESKDKTITTLVENRRKNGRHEYLDIYVHPVNYM